MKTTLLISFFVAGLMAGALAADPNEIKCPDEWELVHRGCYKFVTTGSTWQEANENCKGNHGELASIQSFSEKEKLAARLNEKYSDFSKWWVGFERDEKDPSKWNWLAGIPVDHQVTPWTNYALRRRPGSFCGRIQMVGELKVSIHRCTSSQPFICEYHDITPKTASFRTVTTLPPPIAVPTEAATRAMDTSGFSNDNDERSNTAEGLGSSSTSLHDTAALPCGPGAAGDPALYQRYLQSQISANEAKVNYYAQVSKVYQDALETQKRYYESHQAMVDLQLEQIRQGKVCK